MGLANVKVAGLVSLGVCRFTVSMNPSKCTLMVAFLSIIACQALAESIAIPIPNGGWSIHIDSPPLSAKQGQQDGPNYVYRANGGRFNLSIFVEPQAAPGGSKECYEFYWPKASRNPYINKASVKASNTEKYYRVEYEVAMSANGKSVRQSNVNYYFMSDGKWVDVHISFIEPTKEDAALIAAFDKGLSYGK